MINLMRLYAGHLKNTKRIILVSTIGLICAISIVSSSVIYIDATKGDIVTQLLSSNNNPNSAFDIQMRFNNYYPRENVQAIDSELRSLTTGLIKDSNLNIFHRLELYYAVSGGSTIGNYFVGNSLQSADIGVAVIQLNDAIRQDLRNFTNSNSFLPTNSSQPLEAFELETLFTTQTSGDYQYYKSHDFINNTSDITVTYGKNNPFQTQQFNFTIIGHGKIFNLGSSVGNSGFSLNYNSDKYPTLAKIWKEFGSSYVTLFVNSLTPFLNMIQPDISGIPSMRFSFFGGLNIDLSKLDAFSVASRYNEINHFIDNLENKFYRTNFYLRITSNNAFFTITFQSQDVYLKLASATNTIFFNMMIFAIPILIVALFMTNYSFGLIHKKVVRHIAIYKTRGASQTHMLFFEFIDSIFILFLAVIIGMLAGLPIASIVSKTDFLLSFNNANNSDVVATFLLNFSSIVESLLFFGIFISMIVNLRRTLRLASMSIVDTEKPSEFEEPYWKRYYIDFILFFYGIGSYLILTYFMGDPSNGLLSSPLIVIFLYLMVPSPFAIVIGTILILNRLIPQLLDFIGSKLWFRSGGLLAFSFKNIIRHRQASTRAIMLIAALLTFLILFYSLPYSQVNYDQKTSLYQIGAEGVLNVDVNNYRNLTDIGLVLENVSEILQENFSSSLDGFSPFISTVIYYESNQPTFLFINTSSYAQASAINKFNPGLRFGIENDFKTLRNIPNSIIVSQKTLEDKFLAINDTITMKESNTNITSFPVIDTYNLWPTGPRYFADNHVYAISNIQNILNTNITKISDTVFSQVQSIGFYLNFKDGVNTTDIASNMASFFQTRVSLADYQIQAQDSLDAVIFQFQLGQINANVIMSLVIGIIILIMFSYMQLQDRKREIYTERALGMKLNQTQVLFFVEGILLLLSGIIIGTVLGLFFVEMLSIYMTKGVQIPVYEVLIPWYLVIGTYLGLILLAIVSALVPSFYILKQDISQSFGEN